MRESRASVRESCFRSMLTVLVASNGRYTGKQLRCNSIFVCFADSFGHAVDGRSYTWYQCRLASVWALEVARAIGMDLQSRDS